MLKHIGIVIKHLTLMYYSFHVLSADLLQSAIFSYHEVLSLRHLAVCYDTMFHTCNQIFDPRQAIRELVPYQGELAC